MITILCNIFCAQNNFGNILDPKLLDHGCPLRTANVYAFLLQIIDDSKFQLDLQIVSNAPTPPPRILVVAQTEGGGAPPPEVCSAIFEILVSRFNCGVAAKQ
jgi:hypothetical protein